MYGFNDLPNDEELRVYCSLGVASMLLGAFFYEHNIAPGDIVSEDKKIKLYGRVKDHSELAYLWTSFMVLMPTTGRQGFSAKSMTVTDLGQKFDAPPNKQFFTPSRELANVASSIFKKVSNFISSPNAASSSESDELSSKFKTTSLYHKAFKPVLDEHQVSYDDNERMMCFGHQVPEGKKDLKTKVNAYLYSYLFNTFFKKIQDMPILEVSRQKLEMMHGIGCVKFGEMMYYIDPKVINIINLSKIELNKFGVKGAGFILGACCQMKELVLDSNGLDRLDPSGKIDHVPLCEFLKKTGGSIQAISLRNNGLSNFNKAQLLEIMNSIPASVKEVIIECNNLDEKLEKELINSRGKQLGSFLSTSDNTPKKTPEKITQTNTPTEIRGVKLGSNSQTHFGSSAKQQPSSSSASASRESYTASSSSNPPNI